MYSGPRKDPTGKYRGNNYDPEHAQKKSQRTGDTYNAGVLVVPIPGSGRRGGITRDLGESRGYEQGGNQGEYPHQGYVKPKYDQSYQYQHQHHQSYEPPASARMSGERSYGCQSAYGLERGPCLHRHGDLAPHGSPHSAPPRIMSDPQIVTRELGRSFEQERAGHYSLDQGDYESSPLRHSTGTMENHPSFPQERDRQLQEPTTPRHRDERFNGTASINGGYHARQSASTLEGEDSYLEQASNRSSTSAIDTSSRATPSVHPSRMSQVPSIPHPQPHSHSGSHPQSQSQQQPTRYSNDTSAHTRTPSAQGYHYLEQSRNTPQPSPLYSDGGAVEQINRSNDGSERGGQHTLDQRGPDGFRIPRPPSALSDIRLEPDQRSEHNAREELRLETNTNANANPHTSTDLPSDRIPSTRSNRLAEMASTFLASDLAVPLTPNTIQAAKMGVQWPPTPSSAGSPSQSSQVYRSQPDSGVETPTPARTRSNPHSPTEQDNASALVGATEDAHPPAADVGASTSANASANANANSNNSGDATAQEGSSTPTSTPTPTTTLTPAERLKAKKDELRQKLLAMKQHNLALAASRSENGSVSGSEPSSAGKGQGQKQQESIKTEGKGPNASSPLSSSFDGAIARGSTVDLQSSIVRGNHSLVSGGQQQSVPVRGQISGEKGQLGALSDSHVKSTGNTSIATALPDRVTGSAPPIDAKSATNTGRPVSTPNPSAQTPQERPSTSGKRDRDPHSRTIDTKLASSGQTAAPAEEKEEGELDSPSSPKRSRRHDYRDDHRHRDRHRHRNSHSPNVVAASSARRSRRPRAEEFFEDDALDSPIYRDHERNDRDRETRDRDRRESAVERQGREDRAKMWTLQNQQAKGRGRGYKREASEEQGRESKYGVGDGRRRRQSESAGGAKRPLADRIHPPGDPARPEHLPARPTPLTTTEGRWEHVPQPEYHNARQATGIRPDQGTNREDKRELGQQQEQQQQQQRSNHIYPSRYGDRFDSIHHLGPKDGYHGYSLAAPAKAIGPSADGNIGDRSGLVGRRGSGQGPGFEQPQHHMHHQRRETPPPQPVQMQMQVERGQDDSPFAKAYRQKEMNDARYPHEAHSISSPSRAARIAPLPPTESQSQTQSVPPLHTTIQSPIGPAATNEVMETLAMLKAQIQRLEAQLPGGASATVPAPSAAPLPPAPISDPIPRQASAFPPPSAPSGPLRPTIITRQSLPSAPFDARSNSHPHSHSHSPHGASNRTPNKTRAGNGNPLVIPPGAPRYRPDGRPYLPADGRFTYRGEGDPGLGGAQRSTAKVASPGLASGSVPVMRGTSDSHGGYQHPTQPQPQTFQSQRDHEYREYDLGPDGSGGDHGQVQGRQDAYAQNEEHGHQRQGYGASHLPPAPPTPLGPPYRGGAPPTDRNRDHQYPPPTPSGMSQKSGLPRYIPGTYGQPRGTDLPDERDAPMLERNSFGNKTVPSALHPSTPARHHQHQHQGDGRYRTPQGRSYEAESDHQSGRSSRGRGAESGGGGSGRGRVGTHGHSRGGGASGSSSRGGSSRGPRGRGRGRGRGGY